MDAVGELSTSMRLSELVTAEDGDLTWAAIAKYGMRYASLAYEFEGGRRVGGVPAESSEAHAYDGVCSLRVDRILSRRRHQREAVGTVTCVRRAQQQQQQADGTGTAAGSAWLRFAVGEFRLERVPGGGGCDGGGGGGSSSARGKAASVGTKRSAAPSNCELQLLGDDACLCNEVEGQLEESELRLLVRLVSPAGQRVRLAGGHAGGAAEVVTEEGDLLLENRFRPMGGRKALCLMRRVALVDESSD